MEMHQVRYFLTVARTLNFTRAAEQCNVSQPALTRAIRQLEEELSGELLRHEGKHSHLTELGQRMLPLMQQCYESAMAAKMLASSLRKGSAQPLSVALSHTIDLALLMPMLAEMQRAMGDLRWKLLRRHGSELGELLQKGGIELAVAGPIGQAWDRLDTWPLFEEKFELVVHREHALANGDAIGVGQLAGHRLIVSERCESAQSVLDTLHERNVSITGHMVDWFEDIVELITAGQGIALLPESVGRHAELRRLAVNDLELTRKVFLYGVAGRPRSPAADVLMKLLRARDWSAGARG